MFICISASIGYKRPMLVYRRQQCPSSAPVLAIMRLLLLWTLRKLQTSNNRQLRVHEQKVVCLWFRGKEWEKNLVPQFNLILRVFSKFKCEKKPDDDGSTWLIVRRWDIGIFGARLLVSRCISFFVQPLLVVTVDTPQKVRWLESMFGALFKVFRFKWNIERGILKQVVKDFCTMDYTKGVFNV